MAFDKLLDILKKIQAKNPLLSKRMEEADALSRWETAVGPQIAKHAKALRIQDSVLWIEVDHPIWKTELHYRKRQILDLLNRSSFQASPQANSPAASKSNSNSRQGSPSVSEAAPSVIQDLLLLDSRGKKPPLD